MRPILVVNPSHDETFREFAGRLLAEWMSLGEFETKLRARYPRAAVHARELASEPRIIWYVYREGHWVPSRSIGER